MDILIGENIKRLRSDRNLTQEQLAEALNISSVAVSKWERGETMPDIAMLPRLAYYFQVTIDELMSYDACAVELEINDFVYEHTKAAERYKTKECLRLSKEAYKKYPNDFKVMELYMWDLVGGYADNDPDTVLQHKDELELICEKILKGCSDDFIKRDAYVMKGKILQTLGRTDEAVALYKEKLPDWYQTAGQKTEQLFKKSSPEFIACLEKNIMDLLIFVLNKISKQIWFKTGVSVKEKTDKACMMCRYLESIPIDKKADVNELVTYFAGDFEAKLKSAKADKKTCERIRAFIK